jgi:hypothetical protein
MKTIILLNQKSRALAGFLTLVLCSVFVLQTNAQQNPIKLDSVTEARIAALEKQTALHKPGQSHLVVVGLTTFGFASSKTTSSDGSAPNKYSAFGTDSYEFSPMFLWRQGKKVLLEFEPSFNNDGVGVNWAAISYFAKPNLIFRGGYFVVPFGMYTKKLAAAWINKVATDPIGLPTAQDYGFGVSGGLPLGSMKWNYDLAVTNGLTIDPTANNGTLTNVNLGAASRNKTFVGRLGLLPFSNSSLEIGASGMTGGVANGNTVYQDVRADLYAFDFNLVKNVSPVQINIKSQYNVVNVGNATYVNPLDPTQTYTFNNSSTSGYGQFSVRPTESQVELIKNLELAFRYGQYNTPKNSTWGANTTQTDYGINYWINWRTVLRMTYEILDSKSTVDQSLFASPVPNVKTQSLHIQFAIQL